MGRVGACFPFYTRAQEMPLVLTFLCSLWAISEMMEQMNALDSETYEPGPAILYKVNFLMVISIINKASISPLPLFKRLQTYYL